VSFRTGGPGGGRGGGGGGGMIGQSFQGGPGGGPGNFSISMQGRGMEAADISKIVFLGAGEAKKVGIVLDAQPRAMMINTLFSRNIPGEINMPINEITKSKERVKEFTGEEKLGSNPRLIDLSEIIVDNEDSGFIKSRQNRVSPLKKLLHIKNNNGETYQTINMMNAPEYWQPAVESNYYGKYILSSVYTRGGTGDKEVTWNAIIKEPGHYDIYCYVGKSVDRMLVRGARQGGPGGAGGPGGPGGPGGAGAGPMGNAQRGESPYKDMHYKIYHDEGVEELTLDYPNADGGWNLLGRYYLSTDTAKVVLTNKSEGRIVIGDAIKWVKAN
jgi:hypothetical protein